MYTVAEESQVFQPVQTPPQGQAQSLSLGQQSLSLWIGELEQWADENYLKQIFAQYAAHITSYKVIRDKARAGCAGYGFVDASSREAAEQILSTLNGQPIPGIPGKTYRLKWGQISAEKKAEGPVHSLFVGDVDDEATDAVLESFFRMRYPSVLTAKVVTDPITNKPKNFGFVRFRDASECARAMVEMQGKVMINRPLRLSSATERKPGAAVNSPPTQLLSGGENDPNNTVLFIGGLSASTTADHLRERFEAYGSLLSVKVPVGKGCGFVHFASRRGAETAMAALHGQVVGNSRIRVSWGKQAAAGRSDEDGSAVSTISTWSAAPSPSAAASVSHLAFLTPTSPPSSSSTSSSSSPFSTSPASIASSLSFQSLLPNESEVDAYPLSGPSSRTVSGSSAASLASIASVPSAPITPGGSFFSRFSSLDLSPLSLAVPSSSSPLPSRLPSRTSSSSSAADPMAAVKMGLGGALDYALPGVNGVSGVRGVDDLVDAVGVDAEVPFVDPCHAQPNPRALNMGVVGGHRAALWMSSGVGLGAELHVPAPEPTTAPACASPSPASLSPVSSSASSPSISPLSSPMARNHVYSALAHHAPHVPHVPHARAIPQF